MMYETKQGLSKAQQHGKWLGLTAATILLTACGGGGGGGSTAPTNQAQTITFAAPATLAVGESAKLAATASSNLAVTYASTTTAVCTVADSSVTAVAAGDCNLTASQAGDASYAAAENVSISFGVVSATVAVSAEDVMAGKAATIKLSGKQVAQGITATLAGETVPVTNTGEYAAQITTTPTMAGQLPLVVKQGETELYNDIVTVAVPAATDTAFTVKKTGVTTCGNDTANNIACTDADALGDYNDLNQDGQVQAGADMAYTLVAHQATRDGNTVTENCIYDNTTGLTWEKKTNDDGLRDKDLRYTWYDSNTQTNGGVSGFEVAKPENASEDCLKTLDKCNSEAYIAKLNEQKYCGFNDWRLPNYDELVGLHDYGKTEAPFIDAVFAPIAAIDKPNQGGGNVAGYYMTGQSVPTSARNKEIGYQFFLTQAFSAAQFLQAEGAKNEAFTYHIMAVRN